VGQDADDPHQIEACDRDGNISVKLQGGLVTFLTKEREAEPRKLYAT
jgi:hypothetical protein